MLSIGRTVVEVLLPRRAGEFVVTVPIDIGAQWSRRQVGRGHGRGHQWAVPLVTNAGQSLTTQEEDVAAL
jgi:hypothetical protein